MRAGFAGKVTKAGEIGINNGNGWGPQARWRLGPDDAGWETPDNIHLDRSVLTIEERNNASPGELPAGSRTAVYMRGDKLIIAFNDGGTIRYKYLSLAGTLTDWVHTTSPP